MLYDMVCTLAGVRSGKAAADGGEQGGQQLEIGGD